MYDYTGRIVRSTAGRDKNCCLLVAGIDQQDHMLLLADGKRRKLAHPKRKKPGHVVFLTDGSGEHFQHPVTDALRKGLPVTDRGVRRALAAFRDESGVSREV